VGVEPPSARGGRRCRCNRARAWAGRRRRWEHAALGLPQTLANRIGAAARAGTRLDRVIELFAQARAVWAKAGGSGLLFALELTIRLRLTAIGRRPARDAKRPCLSPRLVRPSWRT
jgi:hypothetical protein